MPITTLAAGYSSASRAGQGWASRRASMAAGPGSSGAAATITTSDSRAETIASAARVATKCSILSQIRWRCAVRSAGVRGPAAGVGVVAAAAEQQAFDQVVADPAGGRGDHPLAAEDDPADGGGVFGDQQAHVLA